VLVLNKKEKADYLLSLYLYAAKESRVWAAAQIRQLKNL
jgi:hypothetical protein